MTTTKQITFIVPPTGVGRTDYSALVTETVQQVLNLNYPEAAVPANQFDDYAEIPLGPTITEYIIGTNANNVRAGSWGIGAVAKNISFHADVDFLVRYNYIDAIEHEIPADVLKSTDKRTSKIYVRAKSSSGTLKVWIEG